MKQPSDYEDSPPRKFYKSIYGLKQAGRKWYEIVCRTLADGFKKTEADRAVFYIHSGTCIIILAIMMSMTALLLANLLRSS